jgi:ferredoxin-NADP reductase
MARAALPGRLNWQLASAVEIIDETPQAKSIVLNAPGWSGHSAGQHLDIRLTAEDGYQAQRSYSIASAPSDDHLVITVERLDDGEVSPYLTGELRVGDEFEIRGPIGGYFVWQNSMTRPLMMLAGGSGVVPFRSMLRAWAAGPRLQTPRLVYSARSLDQVIFREELNALSDNDEVDVQLTLTRSWPPDWSGHRGRIEPGFLRRLTFPVADDPIAYVCGPNGFVEAAAQALVGLGYPPARIRTERFGPSGR